MKKRIQSALFVFLLLSCCMITAFALQTPDVNVNFDTGRVTVTVRGAADSPAGLVIEAAGKRYYVDSSSTDSKGTCVFTTVLPTGSVFNATANVAGSAATFTISTKKSSGGGSTGGGTDGRKQVSLSIDLLTIGKGYILKKTSVPLYDGDTVWSVLKRELDNRDIPYEYEKSSIYVTSIGGEGEFDHGPGSGWMYSVGGKYLDSGCDSYKLSDGDVIRWSYTTDFGKDLGKDPGTDTGSGSEKPTEPENPDETDPTDETENPEQPRPAKSFADVPETHWAHGDIMALTNAGIFNGKSETLFAPEDNVTRAEFAAMLSRMSEKNGKSGNPLPTAASPFTDVPADAWYASNVLWAVEAGVTNGVSDTEFAPDAFITREDMAVMLARFAEYMEYTLPQKLEPTVFTDQAAIDDYAKDAVSLLQRAGILKGTGFGAFSPAGHTTRAQAAAALNRFWELTVGRLSAWEMMTSDRRG